MLLPSSSFLDSLMGESGLVKEGKGGLVPGRPTTHTGDRGELGGLHGDLGLLGVRGVGAESGENVADTGEVGLESILMTGAGSPTLLLLPPEWGEGDRDLRHLLLEKPPLFDLGICDLFSKLTFWKFERLEKEKSLDREDFLELVDSEDTVDMPEVKE